MRASLEELDEYLSFQGFVTVADIATRFQVSEVTARRYLKRLGSNQDVRLVPGGAVSLRPALRQALGQSILLGLERNRVEKMAIAEHAVSLIEYGETLFIDSGSTCYYLVRSLPENRNLTVITHSLDVAMVAKDLRGVRVICLGGEVDDVLNIFAGPLAERQIEAFFADRAFLGAGSIDSHRGTQESTLIEVPLKNLLNRNSRYSYILADSSKFSRHANFASIAVSDLKTVITAASTPDEPVTRLIDAGVEVLRASTSSRLPENHSDLSTDRHRSQDDTKHKHGSSV